MTQPTSARPLPPAPGFLTSSLRIFDLSIGEMLWSRRTIFMVLVVGGPVFIALLLAAAGRPWRAAAERVNAGRTTIRMTGPAIFGLMIWLLYLRFAVPVLGVFYGTALIADEVEDKTITYLFTRPIRRGAVLFGKYLAYLACTMFGRAARRWCWSTCWSCRCAASLGGSFLDLLKDLMLLSLGLAVYGALFAFVGAKFKRPLVIGLVFIFGWEQAALAFPGYLKRFTVAYYLQGLVPHAMPNDGVISLVQGIFRESPSLVGSLAGLVLIFVLFVAWGAWTVERREYVLEQ